MIQQAVKTLLFLDYDGTLTPIVRRPSMAHLSAARKNILRKLARHPGVELAVISGRKLSNLKKQVGIPHIIYVGNHGFEIEIGGEKIVHPGAKKFAVELKKIRARLERMIKVKGAWVEDKGLTLSLHYRVVAENRIKLLRNMFFRLMGPWEKKVRITHGKKVFEIRPAFDWDKGKAVKWLIRKVGETKHFPVYIGDDLTDEDVFRVLRNRGETVKVGKGKTAAAGRLKDIREVYRYLGRFMANES
jgi:trehalose 6-phosphate phosphatase